MSNLNGFVILDKPKGWSSQKAVSRVKYLFKVKKAGHAGTLDPMATGVLIIALGRATKLLSHLVLQNKKYRATIQLGVETDTLDAEGVIINRIKVPNLSSIKDSLLQDALDIFRGGYDQVPPMYSALKKDGKPLYKLAREGISIDRPARSIKIYALDCIAYNKDTQQMEILVHCSKGTYIRSLASDICEKLETCGHLTALRREASGDFADNAMISWEDLQHQVNLNAPKFDNYFLTIDQVFSGFALLNITEDQALRIKNGVKLEQIFNINDGWYRVSCNDMLVAIADIKHGMIASRILI